MRLASLLVGITAASTIAFTATPAHAASLVAGTISFWGVTCSWADATANDVPPHTLTIDHNSINSTISCTGGINLTFTSSPTVTFTPARVLDIDIAVQSPSCAYRSIDVALYYEVSVYHSGPFIAIEQAPKRILCPDTTTIDSVALAFYRSPDGTTQTPGQGAPRDFLSGKAGHAPL